MSAAGSPTGRLRALGLDVPAAGPAAAWHLPVADAGGLLHVSGQVPFVDGGELLHEGRLEGDADIDVGRACARRCAAFVLAQLAAAAGGLENVALVKVTVFVASAPGFTRQPEVAHGASELFLEVLEANGRHARSAVGVAALPLGAPVEVEAVARVLAGSVRRSTSLDTEPYDR
jgi:enamine deaminase RidA (YjgF/YER057c/UK114 family)